MVKLSTNVTKSIKVLFLSQIDQNHSEYRNAVIGQRNLAHNVENVLLSNRNYPKKIKLYHNYNSAYQGFFRNPFYY